MATAAELAIIINAKDNASGSLNAVNASLSKTGKTATEAGAQVTTANTKMSNSMSGLLDSISPIPLGMAGVGIAVTALAKSSFTAASDFQENMNKVEVVFGDASDSIRDFADDAATSFGLSESAALDATGTFGNLFTSMGLGQAAAADMSTGIVALAADLGSFNNIGTDEALEKLRAGLVGEIEPLRTLGVNINAVMVQNKALEMGLAATSKELTAADKAQASYALILEQTTNAQGDFARTSDGAANSLKTMNAEVDDLQVMIGSVLVPVVAELAGKATDAAEGVKWFVDAIESLPGGTDSATASLSALDSALFFATGGTNKLADGVGWLVNKFSDASDETDKFEQSIRDVADAATESTMSFAEMIHGAAEAKAEMERLVAYQSVAIDLLREMSNEAEVGGGSLDKFGGAAGRAAEYAGRANERNSEMFHTLELGSGAAAEAAFNLDKLGEAAETAWGHQDALNTVWNTANENVGFWEKNLSNAQKALAILDGEMEENGKLTDEQQKQYDLLTDATGRYQGGIEDTEGAIVDAAVAQADFVRKQDELNGLLAGGKISASEYARKMGEITAETDPAASSTFNLTAAQGDLVTAIGGVVDKVIDLLVKLGLIPAEKSTDISVPGADDAKQKVHDLGEGIGALPSSFTITANLNADPFYSALEGVAAMIPHSPAKEGPLAFTPDWSWLTEGAAEDIEPGIKRAMDQIRSYLTSIDVDDILGDQSDLNHTIEQLEVLKRGLEQLGDTEGASILADEIARLRAEAEQLAALIGTDAVQAILAQEEAAQAAADAWEAWTASVEAAAEAAAILAAQQKELHDATLTAVEGLASGGESAGSFFEDLLSDYEKAKEAFDFGVLLGVPPEVLEQLGESLNEAQMLLNEGTRALQEALLRGLVDEETLRALAEAGGEWFETLYDQLFGEGALDKFQAGVDEIVEIVEEATKAITGLATLGTNNLSRGGGSGPGMFSPMRDMPTNIWGGGKGVTPVDQIKNDNMDYLDKLSKRDEKFMKMLDEHVDRIEDSNGRLPVAVGKAVRSALAGAMS